MTADELELKLPIRGYVAAKHTSDKPRVVARMLPTGGFHVDKGHRRDSGGTLGIYTE